MDNREKILDAALKLFTTKGYDAVGVQEIADRSGITKPTLYHYFGSKYGLLEALIQMHYTPFVNLLEAEAVCQGDLTVALNRFVSCYFKWVAENKDFFGFFMSMLYSGGDSDTYKAVRPFAEKHTHMMESLFTQASHQIGNMNGRQKQYAVTLSGLIHHWLLLWINTGDAAMISDERAYALVHQFLHGIYV